MHGVDLRQFDLNLLVALDALLSERKVTRAAERLGLSQSATSHALGRLREQLGDPLLVRGPRGMLLTPRAESLAPRVHALLEELAGLLEDEAPFDPAALRGKVHLVCEDYVSSILLPPALKRIGAEAPALDVFVVARPPSLFAALESGEIDLAFGVFRDPPATTRIRTLFRDDFVCMLRRGHPAVKKRLSLAQYVALPHAMIGVGRPGPTVVDHALAKRGLTRRVALRIPSFLAAPLIVAASDLVLTLPRRLATQIAPLAPLELHAPPLPLEGFKFQLAWHARRHEDPAHAWLRGLLAEAASAL